MEEKSIIHQNGLQTSISDWKLKHNMFQTSRNHRQLQNRLTILELQKKKKLKDIQNKLNSHKRFVQNKIYKYKLREAINTNNSDQANRSNSNSRIFQALKQMRTSNIQKKKDQLRQSKHSLFWQTKKMRIQNQEKIKQNQCQTIEVKTSKRNRVRLIQIQSKQNIQNFWQKRLASFQNERKEDVQKKLREHQKSMKMLKKLQKSEHNLLNDIKRTQDIEEQLNQMINKQKRMEGSQLRQLYKQ